MSLPRDFDILQFGSVSEAAVEVHFFYPLLSGMSRGISRLAVQINKSLGRLFIITVYSLLCWNSVVGMQYTTLLFSSHSCNILLRCISQDLLKLI